MNNKKEGPKTESIASNEMDVSENSVHYSNLYRNYNAAVTLTTSKTEYSLKEKDVFEYSVSNIDNDQVLTGAANKYMLNYWDGENWMEYPFDMTSTDIAHIIRKNTTKNFKTNLLSDGNFPMKTGKYRIIKDVEVVMKEGDESYNFKLYSEFKVTSDESTKQNAEGNHQTDSAISKNVKEIIIGEKPSKNTFKKGCDRVTMKLEADISNQQIIVILLNNQSVTVVPSEIWKVDFFSENRWNTIPFKVAFSQSFRIIEPEKEEKTFIPLKHLDSPLASGYYRVRQPIEINYKTGAKKCEITEYFSIRN